MNKKVLGICLGSQLIAEVMGAKVYPNSQKEIGWFPIHLTEQAKHYKFFNFLPQEFPIFHWHGDTFDLPTNTTWLAKSEATKNQAFNYGENVLAFQFHFEFTEALVNEIIKHSKNELVKSTYIQTIEEIGQRKHLFAEAHKRLELLLDRFIE